MSELTDFQKKVFEYVQSTPGRTASLWQIAQYAFPDEWEIPQGRGALIGRIDRAGIKMSDKLMRCPAEDRYGCAQFMSMIPICLSLPADSVFGYDNV
jgi:hypothetical protein